MSTKLVPAKCTQCGAVLSVDPEKDAVVCEFCSTPFIAEKAISAFNAYYIHVEQADNVNIQNAPKGVAESFFDYLGEDTGDNNRNKDGYTPREDAFWGTVLFTVMMVFFLVFFLGLMYFLTKYA